MSLSAWMRQLVSLMQTGQHFLVWKKSKERSSQVKRHSSYQQEAWSRCSRLRKPTKNKEIWENTITVQTRIDAFRQVPRLASRFPIYFSLRKSQNCKKKKKTSPCLGLCVLVFKLLNPTRCYDGGGEDGDIKEAAGGLHSDTRRGETSRRFKVKSDPGEILDACVQIKQTLCQRSGLSGPSIIGRGDY